MAFLLLHNYTDFIILGIDLCKTEDENYVFTFKSNKFKDFKVYHLGEPFKSKVFITMYEK